MDAGGAYRANWSGREYACAHIWRDRAERPRPEAEAASADVPRHAHVYVYIYTYEEKQQQEMEMRPACSAITSSLPSSSHCPLSPFPSSDCLFYVGKKLTHSLSTTTTTYAYVRTLGPPCLLPSFLPSFPPPLFSDTTRTRRGNRKQAATTYVWLPAAMDKRLVGCLVPQGDRIVARIITFSCQDI